MKFKQIFQSNYKFKEVIFLDQDSENTRLKLLLLLLNYCQ